MERISLNRAQQQDLLNWLDNVQSDPRWWMLTDEQRNQVFEQRKYERMVAEWLLEMYYQNLDSQPIEVFDPDFAPPRFVDINSTAVLPPSFDAYYFEPSYGPTLYLNDESGQSIASDDSEQTLFQPIVAESKSSLDEVDNRAILKNLLNPAHLFGSNPYENNITKPRSSNQSNQCPVCNKQYSKRYEMEEHLEREQMYARAGVTFNTLIRKWICKCGLQFSSFRGLGRHSTSCGTLRDIQRY